MRLQGSIVLRGPYGKEDDDKILRFISSHPFNMEIMSGLPTIRQTNSSNKKVEEVKRLTFDDDENDDDDMFMSFSTTRTDVFNDTTLSNTNGFFYQVTGSAALLFEEPFYSTYITPAHKVILQTSNTPVNACNSLAIIGGKYVVIKLDDYSYQRLGVAAKHSDFRLIKNSCYLSVIPLQKLQASSSLLTRVRACLDAIPVLEMTVFSYNCDVDFPSSFNVQTMQTVTTKRKATTSPIPILTPSLLQSFLSTSESTHRNSSEEWNEREKLEQKFENQMKRQDVLCGILDWIGCIEASGLGMNLCFTDAVTPFALPSCFQYVDGNEFNFVNIYNNRGFFSPDIISQKLSFLQDHVNRGKSPFAFMAVYGSKCSAVQWLLDKSVSEFNFVHDDSAHYVILIFPGNVRFVILLTSDMETRL